ncbi:hypothetical protein [Streptomyces sp. NPDC051662]|uniref:hypothetical protein n=1 Tax=Streptomyces sp. NPDC051662 TaxID=3154750 RepID=UPI0034201CC4
MYDAQAEPPEDSHLRSVTQPNRAQSKVRWHQEAASELEDLGDLYGYGLDVPGVQLR